jgi:hypothetical protein
VFFVLVFFVLIVLVDVDANEANEQKKISLSGSITTSAGEW